MEKGWLSGLMAWRDVSFCDQGVSSESATGIKECASSGRIVFNGPGIGYIRVYSTSLGNSTNSQFQSTTNIPHTARSSSKIINMTRLTLFAMGAVLYALTSNALPQVGVMSQEQAAALRGTNGQGCGENQPGEILIMHPDSVTLSGAVAKSITTCPGGTRFKDLTSSLDISFVRNGQTIKVSVCLIETSYNLS